MERVILHLNIADFPVAVERLLDRTLRTRALVIAEPTARAVVYDMSDEAYADGVRKGMVLALARRRCPAALVLPPRPELYRRALGRCLEHALHYTPLVEPAGGQGHLYLDVSGTQRLFGQPADIGWRLRTTLRQDLGLDPIWSVAPNKLLAKVASRLVKPCGEYLVAGGAETAFLAPLPHHGAPHQPVPAGCTRPRPCPWPSWPCSATAAPATSTRPCAAWTRPRWCRPERAAPTSSTSTPLPRTPMTSASCAAPWPRWYSRRAACCAAAGSAAAG